MAMPRLPFRVISVTSSVGEDLNLINPQAYTSYLSIMMKVAEILSDLTSLRVCEYSDAINLVTVNKQLSQSDPVNKNKDPSSIPPQEIKTNDDLRLATELVELHYEIKAIHKDGRIDEELRRGREEVNRVLRELAGR